MSKLANPVLGTYEIETAICNGESKYLETAAKSFEYIDTSICYNNDYCISRVLKRNKKMKVISKIPPQMINEYEFMMSNHLRCLGRNKIDIMLIHNPRSDWKDLALRLESDDRVIESGVSNFTIDDIKKYKDIVGHYPKYNEMEINPLYFDKDLIKFCLDNRIKIIAYAILGGKYNARRNIATYTLPYLLSFASVHADFVIIRSDNYHRIKESSKYVNSLDSDKIDYELYDIESHTDKSIIPTQYRYPMYFTKYIHPTNSDNFLDKGIKIYKEITMDTVDKKTDELNLNSVNRPNNYEFISDYRVFYRYMVDEMVNNITGRYPVGGYIFPSTYVAISRLSFLDCIKGVCRNAYISSVNLVDKSGRLSKVNDGNSELIINSFIE